MEEGVWSGVADARELLEMDLPIGFWNLLIINLPHKFIDFLPLLLPLLDSSKPFVVRGRLVCGNGEIEDVRSLISDISPMAQISLSTLGVNIAQTPNCVP